MGGVVSRSRPRLFCVVPIAGNEKEIRSAHLPVCGMIGIAFIAIAVLTLAACFFLLGAEFVGLVQIFVYVGAVAVLIVFTILLTRRDAKSDRGFNWSGVLVAVAVLGGLLWA